MWEWSLGEVDLIIYTYGAGELIRLVFEALRRIFLNGGFILSLGLVAMVSFLGIFANSALRAQRFNFQFFFVLIIVFYCLLLPKVNIHVEDRLNPEHTGLVQNVPLAVAVPAAFFSTVSKWLTETFESEFSLPGDMSYSANGILMANSLIEAQTKIEIPDQRLAQNFSEFWKSCVFYDILLGLYSWNALTTADNLNEFIGTNTSNNRFFNYTNPGSNRNGDGGATILACRSGFNDYLRADLAPHVQAICAGQAKKVLGVVGVRTSQAWAAISSLWSDEPMDAPEVDEDMNCINTMGDEALSKYAAAMPAALTFYTGVQKNATEITNQMMLANSMKRGLQSFASSADAPAAAQEFALARAQLERNNTFSVMGKIAGKFLPILKNIFECLIYAIAPVVMLMMFSPAAGKVALGYVKALVWINLWAPLYAILHFIMTYYTQNDAAGEFYQSGVNAISLQGYTKLGSIMSEHALLAGYLALSIPMIAWMLISMSGAMMAGLAGRVMQSYDSSVQRASTEATTGNINMGNMAYGNSRVMQEAIAPRSDFGQAEWYDSKTGFNHSLDMGGHQFSEQQKSSLIHSVRLGDSVSQAAQTSLSHAKADEARTSQELSESNSALRSRLSSVMHKVSSSEGTLEGWTNAETTAVSRAEEKVRSNIQSHAEEDGISRQDAKQIAEAMGIGASASMGISKGGFGLGFNGGADYKETEIYQSGNSNVQKWMDAHAKSEKYGETLNDAASAMHSVISSKQSSVGDETITGVQTARADQHAASQAHSRALSDVTTATSALASVSQISAELSQDGADGMLMHGMRSGYSMGQLREHLHNEVFADDPAVAANSKAIMDSLRLGYVNEQMAARGYIPQSYEQDANNIADRSNAAQAALREEGREQVNGAFGGTGGNSGPSAQEKSIREGVQDGIDKTENSFNFGIDQNVDPRGKTLREKETEIDDRVGDGRRPGPP